ncbi:MAG: hypothetical protein RLZZ387_3101 [Chloroflexota bacterium]|jgi:hypothetical protein
MRYLILAILAALLVVGPAAAQTAPGDASVFPSAGPAGTRFSFIASGFRSRERVAVWLNAPDGRVLTVEADQLRRATRYGRVNWFWTVPEGTAAGTYQMVAHGVTSGVERVITIQVGQEPAQPAPAAPDERANVFPGQGRPGTLFRFYARGYLKGESVALWVNRPDGTAQAVEAERIEVAEARLDMAWSAPTDAQAGRWELVIVGRTSGVQVVIPFEIR